MTKIFSFLLLSCVLLSCAQSSGKRTHFFLASYPELEFRDAKGQHVSSRNYIKWEQLNVVTTYQVLNHDLTLVERATGNRYTGSVKAFHWFAYNLQADFEDGKMKRLRYWHPNGELGMDFDQTSKVGKAWNEHKQLVISWRGDQLVYFHPATGHTREIRENDKREYFDNLGRLTHYRVRTDTAIWLYYPDHSPRMKFPYHNDNTIHGVVKQWHPNGKLKALGQYVDNEEEGVWIGYDSLGVETEHQVFKKGKLVEKKVLTLSR